MVKKIIISQNGYEWEFPAHIVADNCAKYYADNDPNTTYQEEYDNIMSFDFDLEAWFLHDMNLSDVPADQIVLIKSPLPQDLPNEDIDFDAFIRE